MLAQTVCGIDLIVSFPFAVATPKQIRDLMQVDGLTNDEVKSHLQVSPYYLFFLRFYLSFFSSTPASNH